MRKEGKIFQVEEGRVTDWSDYDLYLPMGLCVEGGCVEGGFISPGL